MEFPSQTPHNKALFLDRDGVVIEYVPYLSHPEQVKLPDGAGEALKQWQAAGYLLIVITNQSGIGRGYFTQQAVDAVHERIVLEYQHFGVLLDDIFICPHHPQAGCSCRKPSPQMVIEAAKKYNIALSQSFFIGDAPSDLECAIKAQCHPILLLSGLGQSTVKETARYSVTIPVFDKLSDTVALIDHQR